MFIDEVVCASARWQRCCAEDRAEVDPVVLQMGVRRPAPGADHQPTEDTAGFLNGSGAHGKPSAPSDSDRASTCQWSMF